FQFGGRNWIPLVGDWNHDGKDTIGVFDPASAMFYLRNSNSPGAPDAGQFQFGGSNWRPIAGDWNMDGSDSIGVVDPSRATFYLRNSNSSGNPDAGQFQYGSGTSLPLAGDWNGLSALQAAQRVAASQNAEMLTRDLVAPITEE